MTTFIKAAVLALAVTACGQDPAFTQSSAERANSADATAPNGATNTPSGVADSPTGAASATPDGSGDGSGSTGSVAGAEATDGTTTTQPGSETLGGLPVFDPTKGEVFQVQRVGVNFEDLDATQGSDFDFNDVVLCFSGNFLVQNTDVVAETEQTVVAEVFSASGCTHRVDVHIVNPADNTFTSQSFSSKGTASVNLSFKPGFKLEVWETPVEGSCTYARSMHDTQYAKVKPDLCNTTGQ